MMFAPIVPTARMELRISAPIDTDGLTQINEGVFGFIDETFHYKRRVFIQTDSLMRISAACVVYRDGELYSPSFESMVTNYARRLGPPSKTETKRLSSGSVDTKAVFWIDSGLALQLRKTDSFRGFTFSISMLSEPNYVDWCNRLVDV